MSIIHIMTEVNNHIRNRSKNTYHDRSKSSCRFTRSIWSVIQVSSTLFPPRSITNIFGNLLNGIDNMFKKHIRVGEIAFIWSLWLCRNDNVFNDNFFFHLAGYLQSYRYSPFVVFSAASRGPRPILFMEVYARLEATARDTFFQHEWPHSLRIGAPV
jgi:hypothetical protein